MIGENNASLSHTRNEGGNVWVIGAVFLLPFFYMWRLTKGADFLSTYIWYVSTAFNVAEVVGGLCLLGYLIQKRWPTVFEKPPTKIEGGAVYGAINGAGGALAAIAGLLLDSWTTAALAFWPGIFITCALQHVAHWTWHQLKRWYRLYST